MSNKSATVLINSLAQEKAKSGIRVFNLSAGEPKINTPQEIIDAGIKFISNGNIPYPSPLGELELRKLAVNYMNTEFNTDFQANECIVTCGGKFGIYLVIQHLVKKYNEKIGIMIPSPYWVSYPAIAKIMNADPVFIHTSQASDWKITPDMLRNSYTNNCKILILNNAVNPTGVLYSQEEIDEIMKTAVELDMYIISDEVYSGLVYDDTFASCGNIKYKNQTIIIQSTSKNFGMTGWRVGFVFADKDIINELESLNSQSTTGVSLICQHGAIAGLKNAESINKKINDEMKKRRDVLIAALHQYCNVTISPPKSALYVWISLAEICVNGLTDEEFCMIALKDANIAMVPGTAFGCPNYLRLSFGASEYDLVQGTKKLGEFIQLHNKPTPKTKL